MKYIHTHLEGIRKLEGWLSVKIDFAEKVIILSYCCRRAKREATPLSLGYLGNVVTLW